MRVFEVVLFRDARAWQSGTAAPMLWRRPWRGGHRGARDMAAPMALWVGVLVGSSYGVTKGWSSIWRELCKNATLPPDNHPKDGKKNFQVVKQVPGT